MITENYPIEAEEMRQAYVSGLLDAARRESRIVALNCDLSSSMGIGAFAREFPDRYFNLGIQEANVCGMAAGLSAVGFIPFFHSFAVFSSRRIFDQVFLSCAYAGLNVKIMGADAGVSATYNGGTHMAFEDVGMMSLIPDITIVEPCDNKMAAALVPLLAEQEGVCYMRMARKLVHQIYSELPALSLGKGNLLRDGRDVTIISCGLLVHESLKASDMLGEAGISARVIDMFTIHPIDRGLILESARQTGAIVTAENHSTRGGLGAAVAEVLEESLAVPLERVGVQSSFGEVGDQDYLMEHFGLTAKHIMEKCLKAVNRKTKRLER